MMIARPLLIATLLAAVAVAFQPRPKVTVGRPTPAAQCVPVEQIDHSIWDSLLQRYVNASGDVAYAAWHDSAADCVQLDNYLAQLSAACFPETTSRSALLAYWINAYNAVTVAGILREYPTTSIRNHTPALLGYNVWKDFKLAVGPAEFSLEQIEHQILRPLGEPRIHFAIVCASKGCPRLRSEAYVASRLEDQLADNARWFFAEPTKLAADARARTLAVSPILLWFARDFGPDEAAQLNAITPWLPTDVQVLLATGAPRLRYLDYDWRLNDQAPP